MTATAKPPKEQSSPTAWRSPLRRPEYTVGVEEELMLVDGRTLEPAAAIEAIIAGEADHGPAKRELMQCQAELSTGPCRTAGELHEALVSLRAQLRRDADAHGVLVGAAGTHPLSLAEDQPITTAPRPREILAALRFAARRTLCFGMHVHVGVGGSEKAFQILEALIGDLPLLLGLSASSPFYAGEETGLASTRTVILSNMPRTGIPPIFHSYREYESTLDRLSRAGAVPDYTYLWWDVRTQPRFGTVEVRIMDVQPSATDSAALGGLVQSLVRHYGKLHDRGAGFAKADRLIANENRWLASRYGLRARLVCDTDDAVGARELITDLLDRVEDDAAALGNEWALERVAAMAAEGTSSDRQLRLLRSGKRVDEILRELVEETAGEGERSEQR